jgi:DNA-binding response OmpR family regulator
VEHAVTNRRFAEKAAYMRILVVEDDPILAITLENELIDAGHEVIGPATTAAEGHQLALAHRPDVALLNINLKNGSSGVDLARSMLADLGTPSIFISGNMQEARQGRDAAIGYLSKPYQFSAVLQSIEIAAKIGKGEKHGLPPHGLELYHRSFFDG